MLGTSQLAHSSQRPFDSAVTAVSAYLSRFNLLEGEQRVVVGFSGGKDSLLLLRILDELGIETLPVTVRLWPQFDVELAARVAAQAGRTVDVIDMLCRSEVSSRIASVHRIADDMASSGSLSGTSPCTGCYNLKAEALARYAREHDTRLIAFGHHLTDAASSLIKMALMVHDYASSQQQPYQHARFIGLCREWRPTFESADFPASALAREINGYISNGLVATDEPPRQDLLGSAGGCRIVRPLLALWENDVEALKDGFGWETAGSGCGHGLHARVQTPRELVQHTLIAPSSANCRATLLQWIERGLLRDGSARRNTRNERHQILPGYRPPSQKH